MSVQERINQLRKEIEQHNYNYYVFDKPTIPDVEFNQYVNEIKKG